MSVMLGKISVKDLHGPWSDFMDKLQGEESETWFTAFKKFLRKENPWEVVVKTTQKFLEFIGKVTIDAPQSTDSNKFFTTREGLWTEDSFKELFVGSNNQVAGVITVSKHKINKNAYDREIVAELPEGYVFEAEEFCQVAANLITEQWGGKVGDLLNNGYANIFYVRSKDKKKVFAVSINWNSAGSEWGVFVCSLDVYQWTAEIVVFSRN